LVGTRHPGRSESPTYPRPISQEYAFDIGLLRELRDIERQIAEELGQWVSRYQTQVMKSWADIPDALIREAIEQGERLAAAQATK